MKWFVLVEFRSSLSSRVGRIIRRVNYEPDYDRNTNGCYWLTHEVGRIRIGLAVVDLGKSVLSYTDGI